MQHASIPVDPRFIVGRVDPRLFGSFVEHMGRCVYTGIYEPGHKQANASGFRDDVLALARELGVTIIRYPGGNFVSAYDWEDGIGPRENRPTRLDLAWRSTETNEVGLNEFVAWCRQADIEPMLVVNLGTRGIDAARTMVEYCNHPGGSYWSDLRREHGYPEPHGVKTWCLGNEMDAPWQIGHKTAHEYGRIALETAKAMRRVDPSIELVVAGSSNSKMPTFPEWEAVLLEHVYEQVDYLSLHNYCDVDAIGDLDSFLASSLSMDEFITTVIGTCDQLRSRVRSRKQLHLAFDEWNVWRQTHFHSQPREPWTKAPRLAEDTYDLADALVVGTLLITLLRHCARVRIACIAQLVNVIAPIKTEPGGATWRQTIFFPFAAIARHAKGTVLRIEPTTPVYDTAQFGPAPLLESIATHDEDAGEVTVFAVNRSRVDDLALAADLRALGPCQLIEHQVLTHPDIHATNDADEPGRVQPSTNSRSHVKDERLDAALPAQSWNVIRLRTDQP